MILWEPSIYLNLPIPVIHSIKDPSLFACLWAVHPCLSWKPVSRIGDDYGWQEGIVPGNLTHRSPASAPHCAQPCAPHNRGQRGRHTEGRSTIQGTQPSNPNSSDVEGKPPVKKMHVQLEFGHKGKERKGLPNGLWQFFSEYEP